MKAAFLVLVMHLLIAGQGCSVVDDCDDAEDICLARVSVAFDTLITRDMYHITLLQGLSRWDFGPVDFANPSWSPAEVRLCGRGELVMDFTITADDGGIVSAGKMRWGLKPDRRLLIALWRDDHRRATHVPTNWKAFPIVNAQFKTSEQDSMFVVWSVNSISHPVQY